MSRVLISCNHVLMLKQVLHGTTTTTTTTNSSNNDDDNNNNDNNNGLYFTRDKDTYPMLQLFMNTVKHNKMNKLIIES